VAARDGVGAGGELMAWLVGGGEEVLGWIYGGEGGHDGA
jgi:hypothetical protein